ncbi:hypothetical protein CVT25_003919 [Psilocybe cyanescens]|uniref:Uncharacterized protein n=1 Tax=Psilocybe cyanescens TaxID=93625 RepID=A0A409XIV6_PSICY|nr:hypothetical protein CVT25_003919 [Psilocybe cyanescens]
MEAFDKMVTGPMSRIATAVAMPGTISQPATHSVVQDVPLRAGNTSNSDAMCRIPSAQDPQQPMDEQITRRVHRRPSWVQTESPEYKVSIMHDAQCPQIESTRELYGWPKGLLPKKRMPRTPEHQHEEHRGHIVRTDRRRRRQRNSSSEYSKHREAPREDSSERDELVEIQPKPLQGKLNPILCDRCRRANTDCYDRVQGCGACFRCNRQKVKCSLGIRAISHRNRRKSSTSRKPKSRRIIEVLDEPSAEEEEYDEEDEDIQMDILEIPATAVVAESSRSAQTRAGTSARHIREVSAPSDEHYTGHFSAIEKGKNCDLPEATDNEELAARVDILLTKLDSVTADAASALSMAYDCNLACVELEKSAAHGPNAGLGHRVTQLEGKMNDILGKLDMFETQFSDISTILRKLSTNGMLILNQGALGPIQSVEDNLISNDMEVEKDAELVSDGPYEAKNVDANSITQTVELSADIRSVAGDDSDSGPYVPISPPMVEQHGEDDSVSGPDPSNSMIHVNNAQEEQRELISSVHKDFPSVQLIPPTPNNSQEQATYSAQIIVAGTHQAASTVPGNATSAELASYTTHTSPTLQALESLPNLVETSTHLGLITFGPDDVNVGSEVGNGVELSVAGGSESVDISRESADIGPEPTLSAAPPLTLVATQSLLTPPLLSQNDTNDRRRSPHLTSPHPSPMVSRSPTPGRPGKCPRTDISPATEKSKRPRQG